MLNLTDPEAEVLNSIVDIFRLLNVKSIETLTPVALYLCGLLLIIELATDWTLYEGNLRLSKIINDVVKGSFFFFIIFNWGRFVFIIQDFFTHVGMLGGGEKYGKMLGPSDILNRGFDSCVELFDALTGTSSDATQQGPGGGGGSFLTSNGSGGVVKPQNNKSSSGSSVLDLFFGKVSLLAMLTYLVAIGMIIFAHLWIALQVFICQIEYSIFTALGLIFVPFGVLRHTSFLFQKTISGLVNFGVKLMGLFFLIAIANTSLNLMKQPTIEAGAPFSAYLKIGLVYLCIAYLIWELPDKLGSLMSGSPTLSGGKLAGTAKAAAGFAAGAVTGGTATALAVAGDVYETKQMASKPKDGTGDGGTSGSSSALGSSGQGAGTEKAPVYTGPSSSGSSSGGNGGGGGVVFASATNEQGAGRSTAPQYEGQGGGGNTGGAPSGGASGTASSGDAGAAAPAGGGSGGTAGGGQKGNAAPPDPGPEKEYQGTPKTAFGQMTKTVSDIMDGGTFRRFVKYEAEQALAGSILAPWIRGRENAQRRQQKWRAFRDGKYGGQDAITNYRENNKPVEQNSNIRKEWNDLE